MKILPKRFLLVLLQTLSLCASGLAGEFFIRNGDRVVFLGDSITEQRLYTTYIEAYALTRYPEWKLWFRNVGWGGDTAWLRQRAHPNESQLFAADETVQQKMIESAVGRGLERDVLPLRPTAVTVKFGMNDHAYQAFREDIFKAYVRSQTQIAKVLHSKGARVAFLTPQPIEEKRADPDKDVKNESLRKFCDGLKEVAVKSDSTFVDQFDPYMAIMMHERQDNPKAAIGGGDAVHPGPPGHTLMAWAVLKGLGASPLVSRVEIDADAKKVSAAEGCRIAHLKVADGVVSFERSDDALPMPIDSKAEPALKLAPVLDDLSLYELRVTGLPAGQYELIVDGDTACKVTGEELGKGCNLTLKAGAITKQAQEVLRLIFEKNNLFFHRWREIQLFTLPAWAQIPEVEAKRTEELQKLDRQLAELEKQIDSARRPKMRHFEIKQSGK